MRTLRSSLGHREYQIFYSLLPRLVEELLEFSQRIRLRTFGYLCCPALITDLQLALSRVLNSPDLIT